MKKAKKKKLTKKTKRTLEKFGLDTKIVNKVVRTTEELVKDVPKYIIFRTKGDLFFEYSGVKLVLKKGKDYVSTISYFSELKRNIKKQPGVFEDPVEPSNITFIEKFRRYYGQDLTDKRLLVWRFGGIGDLIMIQPLIQYLKDKYPTCKITFATSFENVEILRCWPEGLIDNIVLIPFEAELLDNCDYHLTFEGTLERCNELKVETGVRMYAKVAGVDLDESIYQPKLIPDVRKNIDDYLLVDFSKLIVIQSRASTENRCISDDVLLQIINLLLERGFSVGLIDSYPNSQKIDNFLYSYKPYLFNGGCSIINLASYSKSLYDCVYMISKCLGVIAVDSAISHIGPALGKPTVGIYTSFLGETRLKSYKNTDWYNVSSHWNECGRCPCFYLAFQMKNCPFAKQGIFPKCTEAVDPRIVVKKLLNLLNMNDLPVLIEEVENLNELNSKYRDGSWCVVEKKEKVINKDEKNQTDVQYKSKDLLINSSAYYYKYQNDKNYFLKYKKAEFGKDVYYKGIDLSNKSLNIVRYLGIGDVLALQPIFKYIKKNYPTCKTYLTTSDKCIPIIKCWPNNLVDEIIQFQLEYDLDLLKNIDYYSYLNEEMFFVKVKDRKLKSSSLTENFMYFMKLEHDDLDDWIYTLNIEDDLVEDVKKSNVITDRCVTLNLTASVVFRLMHPSKIAEIISIFGDLGFTVYIVDRTENMSIYRNAIMAYRNKITKDASFVKFMDTYTKNDWKKVMAVIKAVNCTFVSDSGISHISAALNAPTFTIYTQTPNRLEKFNNRNVYSYVISDFWNNCNRCPCIYYTQRLYSCPYALNDKHPGCCLEAINVIDVMENFLNFYERSVNK